MLRYNKPKTLTHNFRTFKSQRSNYHFATPVKPGWPGVFQNLWKISIFLTKAALQFLHALIIIFAALDGKPKRYTADEAFARGGAGLNNTDFENDWEYHRYRNLMRLDERE